MLKPWTFRDVDHFSFFSIIMSRTVCSTLCCGEQAAQDVKSFADKSVESRTGKAALSMEVYLNQKGLGERDFKRERKKICKLVVCGVE